MCSVIWEHILTAVVQLRLASPDSRCFAGMMTVGAMTAGTVVADVMTAGTTVADVMTAGTTVADVMTAGTTVADVMTAGTTVADVMTAGTWTAAGRRLADTKKLSPQSFGLQNRLCPPP